MSWLIWVQCFSCLVSCWCMHGVSDVCGGLNEANSLSIYWGSKLILAPLDMSKRREMELSHTNVPLIHPM